MDVAVGTLNLNNLFSRYNLSAEIASLASARAAVTDTTHLARDVLEAELVSPSRARRLFTIFNTHLRSHFLAPGETETGVNAGRLQRSAVAVQILAVELAGTANWPKH